MLISLLKEFNIDFCAVIDGNITDIIFMLPYYPYTNYPKNCARIDSFYIASNVLYKRVKEISEVLKNNGYEIVDRQLHLKKVAEKGGLGSILNNQLLTSKKYGSRTTLQGISVVGKYEYLADDRVDKICDTCHKCDFACPNNALNKGVFTREHCIRHKQDFSNEYFEIVGNRVLGCSECQNVCPYNNHIQSIDIPKDIEKIFDYESIFEMIKNGKKGLLPLANLIGSNMARPTIVFNLVVNSLLASKNYDYTQTISTFVCSKSQNIALKAKFYLDSISKKI